MGWDFFDWTYELVFISRGALTAVRYIIEILEDHVVPYAGCIGENFDLMHDNAWPHVGQFVTEYLEEVGIWVMSWPTKIPDINPIDHMWDNSKQMFRALESSPCNIGRPRNCHQRRMGPNSPRNNKNINKVIKTANAGCHLSKRREYPILN